MPDHSAPASSFLLNTKRRMLFIDECNSAASAEVRSSLEDRIQQWGIGLVSISDTKEKWESLRRALSSDSDGMSDIAMVVVFIGSKNLKKWTKRLESWDRQKKNATKDTELRDLPWWIISNNSRTSNTRTNQYLLFRQDDLASQLNGIEAAQQLEDTRWRAFVGVVNKPSGDQNFARALLLNSAVRLLDLWKDSGDNVQFTSLLNRHLQFAKANMLDRARRQDERASTEQAVIELDRAYITALVKEQMPDLNPEVFECVQRIMPLEASFNIKANPAEVFALGLVFFSILVPYVMKNPREFGSLCQISLSNADAKERSLDCCFRVPHSDNHWLPVLDGPNWKSTMKDGWTVIQFPISDVSADGRESDATSCDVD